MEGWALENRLRLFLERKAKAEQVSKSESSRSLKTSSPVPFNCHVVGVKSRLLSRQEMRSERTEKSKKEETRIVYSKKDDLSLASKIGEKLKVDSSVLTVIIEKVAKKEIRNFEEFLSYFKKLKNKKKNLIKTNDRPWINLKRAEIIWAVKKKPARLVYLSKNSNKQRSLSEKKTDIRGWTPSRTDEIKFRASQMRKTITGDKDRDFDEEKQKKIDINNEDKKAKGTPSGKIDKEKIGDFKQKDLELNLKAGEGQDEENEMRQLWETIYKENIGENLQTDLPILNPSLSKRHLSKQKVKKNKKPNKKTEENQVSLSKKEDSDYGSIATGKKANSEPYLLATQSISTENYTTNSNTLLNANAEGVEKDSNFSKKLLKKLLKKRPRKEKSCKKNSTSKFIQNFSSNILNLIQKTREKNTKEILYNTFESHLKKILENSKSLIPSPSCKETLTAFFKNKEIKPAVIPNFWPEPVKKNGVSKSLSRTIFDNLIDEDNRRRQLLKMKFLKNQENFLKLSQRSEFFIKDIDNHSPFTPTPIDPSVLEHKRLMSLKLNKLISKKILKRESIHSKCKISFN